MSNKVRQRDPPSCHSLIWSSAKCVPCPVSPHHHLIILHLPTHTHTRMHLPWACKQEPVFHFAFPKGRGQERHRERNYETRSLHSFQFNGHCSMSCFDKEWIWASVFSMISYQGITYGSVVGAYSMFASKKFLGCQFWGWNMIWNSISQPRFLTFQSAAYSFHPPLISMW